MLLYREKSKQHTHTHKQKRPVRTKNEFCKVEGQLCKAKLYFNTLKMDNPKWSYEANCIHNSIKIK